MLEIMTTITSVVLDSFIEQPGPEKSTIPSYPSNKKLEDKHGVVNSKKDQRIGEAPTTKLERGVSVPPKLAIAPDIDSANSEVRVHQQPNVKLDRGISLPSNVKLDEGLNIPFKATSDRRNGAPTSVVDKKHRWTQITPALYATPVSTPLPDAPSSFVPSPYVVNHKRRGPRLMKSFSEDEVATFDRATVENGSSEVVSKDSAVCEAPNLLVDLNVDDDLTSFGREDVKEKVSSEELGGNNVEESLAGVDEAEDFADPQDSASVVSVGETEGIVAAERSSNAITPMAEFYDAWEELSPASETHNASLPDIESELLEVRLSLLTEIEKRKQAEETLKNMQEKWRRIREQLSLVGLNLPVNGDIAAEMCQQVFLARFVANSIGRATARAEVEAEMEAQVNLKNLEIARLWDKVHYYEAVNLEMSQRNQEVIETARQLRQRRKRRQRWVVFGSIATAVSIGSAVLAYSYLKGSSSSSSSSTSSNHRAN